MTKPRARVSNPGDDALTTGPRASGPAPEPVPIDVAMSRVERKRAARLQRVLRTAAQVFAERGYEGTGLEEVASRLDLRGPSLYHYCTSKDDLFLRCIETTAAAVVERLEQVAGSGASPLARLQRLFYEQVLFQIREYPDVVPLFLRIYVPVEAIRARTRELRRAHAQVFRRVAKEAVDAGEIDADMWWMRTLLAMGAMAHVQEWYRMDGTQGPEELAAQIAGVLIDQLRAPAGAVGKPSAARLPAAPVARHDRTGTRAGTRDSG
jgi:AcrR family transcriptional regulator